MTPFLFVGLRYPPIWKIEIFKLKKMVRRQIDEKFPNVGILFCFHEKKLYVSYWLEILNKYNNKVSFEYQYLINYPKLVTCKCYPSLENHDTFHHLFLFFSEKNFSWCNIIQQTKKVWPYVAINIKGNNCTCTGRYSVWMGPSLGCHI